MMKTIHKTTTKCLALVVLMLVTMLTGAQADTVEKTATFDSSLWGTSSLTLQDGASWTSGEVTMTAGAPDQSDNNVTSDGKLYMVLSSSLTFAVPEGQTLTKVVLTCSGSFTPTANTGTMTATSSGYQWTGSTSNLVVKFGDEYDRDGFYIDNIVVTYEADLGALTTTTSTGATYDFTANATSFVDVSLQAKTITAGIQEMYLDGFQASTDPMITRSPTNGATYLHMPAGSHLWLKKSDSGSNIYITRAVFTYASGTPDVSANGGEYDSSTGIWLGQEDEVIFTFNDGADIQLVQADAAAYAKVSVTTYGRGQTAVDGVGINLENDLNGNPTGTTTVYVAVGGSLALAMTPDDARHELSTASVRESYWDAEDNYHSDETDFLNDAKENGSYTMWNIQHNCDVTIRYSWITHLISYHASGNGTINLVATYLDDDGTSMSYDQAEQMYGGEAARDNTEDRKISIGTGGTVNMIMTADTGYKLSSLMVNGVEMVNSENLAKDGSVYTYTINPLTAAQNISATFVNDTPEAYAVLSDNNTVLTFYYDTEKESRGGVVVGADTGISGISNASAGETVTSVVFDQSMANCTTITNTASWFSNFTQLSRITGLEYLNTSNVTSMNNMFYNCSQLSDIDLSHFDTGRVTDMGGMFMQCSSLTTLDLTSFSTAAVTNMVAMFFDCSSLVTITVGQGWTTSNLGSSSGSSMFSGCTSLKGSKGTTYDADHTDAAYARIDGGPNSATPGYLTDVNAPTEYDVLVTVWGDGSVSIGNGTIAGGTGGSEEHITMPAGGTMTLTITPNTGSALGSLMLDDTDVTSQVSTSVEGVMTYTLSSIYDPHSITVTFVNNTPEAYARLTGEQGGNRVLTFYYDTNKEDSDYGVGPFASSSDRGWQSETNSITRVVFDSSFENATTITSTAYWFNEMNGLTAIEGLQYLNTSNVTNMYAMFYNCSSLASLDVTSFNTQNVTNMESMFGGCRSLTSLDLSSFNTQNVTNMYGMFQDCSSLTSLDLSRFDTQNVTSMSSMFYRCEALASINFGTINTAKVTDMSNMFYDCFSLRSLDLSSFNTQNVTDMWDMFGVCYGLSSLDLSSFDTQRVTNMHGMFNGSYELTTIYVSSSWVTNTNTYGEGMFTGCYKLVGGRGTGYDANHVDATYACIDMAPDAPGYFTRTVVMGDANDDGSVTIADAVATVTNILNEATNEYFSQSKADMNSDSEIDIFDVTLIVNAVLAASPAPAYNGGNIAAEDVRLEAQANSLTMGIDGSAQYTAFQFDVTLPEGTTLEGVRLASGATNHQLAYQKVSDNTYRVVGLSMTNQQLSAANGRLVQLQLSGNADESNVKMSNVLFVGQPASDATAIRNHVTDGAADNGAIYDLNGRYVGNDRRQLSKGIYIINHKKVNIK